ncbi:amidase [Tamaricihabitans halophyticus]|nr:amidase [Tamaricihabitans halophyticus]
MVDPLLLPIRELTASFAAGELSPAELTADVLRRIDELDDQLHAYLTVTPSLASSQAEAATIAYRADDRRPLLGVPVSVKDAFEVRGTRTTYGSLVHRGNTASADSGTVRRLRAAGAVFVGKTNTAEFGQSATTDNLLGPDTRNPWDTDRTPGGSSGGAAASVAAGLAHTALGSDGGGSVRIPAAFCGLVGVKPTVGLCPNENGLQAMTEFVSPGPLVSCVDDARIVLGVLAGRDYPRRPTGGSLRIAWCPRPEGRPVQPDLADSVADVAKLLAESGHRVTECDLPVRGWQEIFGPLVLDDERRHRGDLLDTEVELTDYQQATLRGARELEPGTVTAARRALITYRAAIAEFFESVDIVLTPTTAVPAFPLGERPQSIDGHPVGALWGAFPFAAPFNVAGTPALSLPCGTVGGLPVGAQLVAARHREQLLLDLAEELEVAIGFDRTPLHQATGRAS